MQEEWFHEEVSEEMAEDLIMEEGIVTIIAVVLALLLHQGSFNFINIFFNRSNSRKRDRKRKSERRSRSGSRNRNHKSRSRSRDRNHKKKSSRRSRS